MYSGKKFLLFTKPHLPHLLFLFFFIASLVKKNLQNYFNKYQRIGVEFLKLYSFLIDNFISAIPYLILKKRTEEKKIDKNENIKNNILSIDYIYSNKTSEDKDIKIEKAFNLILVITITDFIAEIISTIFYIIKEEKGLEVQLSNLNSTLIINVIIIFLLSKKILKTNFFKHHYCSLIMTILCLLTLVITDLINIINNSKGSLLWDIIYIFVRIVGIILYSLSDVLAKVVFLYHYFNPYLLLLNKAAVKFVGLIIFSFPFIFIKLEDSNGEEKSAFAMLKTVFDDKINILIIIGFIIVSFFYTIIIYLIIDFFSPNHFVIARAFENFGVLIINIIIYGPDSEKYIILKIIMYIILIIVSLIFNEFIVINICGLGKNTKLFLNYEADNEIKMVQNDKNDINVDESEIKMTLSETELASYL